MKKAEQRQASPRDLMSDQEVVRCAGDLGFVLRERVYDIREDGSKGSERFIRLRVRSFQRTWTRREAVGTRGHQAIPRADAGGE